MTNPLLDELDTSGVIPNITLELPTQARFYDDDMFVEGIDPADLPVLPIGVLDDNSIRDPVMLATGKSTIRLLRHVCPGILHPEQLAEVDVEAILVASRLVSYGPELHISHTCQNPELKPEDEITDPEEPFVCREKNDIVVDLQEFILRYGSLQDMERFDLTLDKLGQTVHLRPSTYEMSIKIMMEVYKAGKQFKEISQVEVDDALMDERLMQSYVEVIDSTINTNIDALLHSIQSVTTKSGSVESDPQIIEQWLLRLPRPIVDQIKDRITDISMRLKKIPELTYNCQGCGHENTFYVQLDPQMLFTPAEGSKTPNKPSAPSKRTGKKGKPHSKVSRK